MLDKIDARNCEIKKLGKDITRSFLDTYHLQRSCNFSLAYGLYYEEELIQVMAFGRPRFNKSYQWEIIRDCTKSNLIVNGGVSKLWKCFINNNSVHSCIVYSYPHDENNLYTNKYVDYCGFKNKQKAKSKKKIYFEGVWGGKFKRIDKSILEKHGADRLLGGSFGSDKTNEQILLDLGFERKEEDGFAPQVDIYFPFGVVFKCTDINTGKFYIGKCEIKSKWENGYIGSGRKWKSHYNKYKDSHNFERVILKDNFRSPKEMFTYEAKSIQSYCTKIDGRYVISDKNCMNIITESQAVVRPCKICGGYLSHERNCPEYQEPRKPEPCEFCGRRNGMHKKSCPKHRYKKPEPCPECGAINGHRDSCSKSKGKCPECGYSLKSNRHAKSCSHYKEVVSRASNCSECGGRRGHHRDGCSKQKVCDICGGRDGNHREGCDKKKISTCPECGSRTHHKPWCSKYKKAKNCPECGVVGNHKKSCSHYKARICSECGGKSGHHKVECSHFKNRDTSSAI